MFKSGKAMRGKISRRLKRIDPFIHSTNYFICILESLFSITKHSSSHGADHIIKLIFMWTGYLGQENSEEVRDPSLKMV
jgi:hypothetical protein